jgi:hypothetical protein
MAALKGALVNLGAGLLGALPNVVVFQFNPERITRTPALARPPVPRDGSGTGDASQQPDQPSESLSFTLRVDATDQLASANPIAAASGILPTLSALELLMVPRSTLPVDLFGPSGGPRPHQHPPEKLPAVLFVFGPSRVLPVSVTGLSVVETQHDVLLNPVRADVTVSLRVLTPSQLAQEAALERGAYRYSLAVKEAMAALNFANAAAIGVNPSLSPSI